MDNCKKCGTEMKTHYGKFCPLCDTDLIIVKKETFYDLFKLMYHMEAKGFMSMEKYWREYVLESYSLTNDIYLDMYFESDSEDEEINKYHDYVRKLLNIKEENYSQAIMWISW